MSKEIFQIDSIAKKVLEFLAEEENTTISIVLAVEIACDCTYLGTVADLSDEENDEDILIVPHIQKYLEAKHAAYESITFEMGELTKKQLEILSQKYKLPKPQVIAFLVHNVDMARHQNPIDETKRTPCDYKNCFVKIHKETKHFFLIRKGKIVISSLIFLLGKCDGIFSFVD